MRASTHGGGDEAPGGLAGAGAVPAVPGYETGELLGVGSSGAVWSAVRETDGRLVALKVVRAARAGAGQAAVREIGLLGRAATGHLVGVHDAVALADGDLVLVLEHLAGGNLRTLVRARGRLTPAEVVTVLSPVASALGRLHAAGVVHGDVSPGNVLLDGSGRPVLADLGTARLVGERPVEVDGTDGFVAPEVLIGGAPAPAADVFAVGALAWLCLTGRVPGPAPLRGTLAAALATEGDDVGGDAAYAALVPVVERCLDATPARRPGADELALAIFDSGPASPIDLVPGVDDVSALTHRIRVAAREAPRPVRDARLWRRLLGLVAVRPLRLSRPVRLAPRPRGRHSARVSRFRRVPVVALVVLALVAGLFAASSALAHHPQAEADPVRAGRALPRQALDADPVRDRSSAVTDPAALLTALLRRRAEAFARGEPAALAAVDAPGSAAMARDVPVLTRVQEDGLRYRSLRFDVLDAQVVHVGSTSAVLRARVATAAYVVEGGGGSQGRPAATGPPILVDLTWSGSQWRVSDIRST